MNVPKNGVAKELRSYFGSILIFLFITGMIVFLIKFPVLDSNKETILMLIGSIAASIPLLIQSITGTKPDDVNALKGTIEKKEDQIALLVKAKDDLEKMVIDLQKEMLSNQADIMDNIVLKAALEHDDRFLAKQTLNKKMEIVKCKCGNTQNQNGNCDGSHLKSK